MSDEGRTERLEAASGTETRKLAAIMFTDMVGFSRLMHESEEKGQGKGGNAGSGEEGWFFHNNLGTDSIKLRVSWKQGAVPLSVYSLGMAVFPSKQI